MPRKTKELQAKAAEIEKETIEGEAETKGDKPVKTDVEFAKKVEAETSKKAGHDELIRKSCLPNGRFIVLDLGGRYRVVNKYRQWITPFMPLKDAVMLAQKMNRKDPEQKKALTPLEGVKIQADLNDERIANPIIITR